MCLHFRWFPLRAIDVFLYCPRILENEISSTKVSELDILIPQNWIVAVQYHVKQTWQRGSCSLVARNVIELSSSIFNLNFYHHHYYWTICMQYLIATAKYFSDRCQRKINFTLSVDARRLSVFKPGKHTFGLYKSIVDFFRRIFSDILRMLNLEFKFVICTKASD